MRISKKILVGSIGSLLGSLVLTSAPALAASTFSNNLWQFASGNGASIIDFNKGASGIWDNGELHVATDNFMFLDAGHRVTVSNALFLNNGALVVANTAQVGNLNAVNSVHSDGTVTAGGGVSSDVTRPTGATGSFQPVAGDLTYQGAAGGTSSFHGGVMGHFHGDTLTNTNATYHAGVIGGYSVTTSDALTGPKAGVVGFVGADGATGAANAGVMSVIDGDGGVVTANAAYGVQYLNSTPGSKFSYGLDLSHVAAGAYAAVTYGTADIRLANGVTILSGTGAPASSGATACNLGAGKPELPLGSLYLNASGGTSTSLYLCTAANTWTPK